VGVARNRNLAYRNLTERRHSAAIQSRTIVFRWRTREDDQRDAEAASAAVESIYSAAAFKAS
jgi:hypothetical protein